MAADRVSARPAPRAAAAPDYAWAGATATRRVPSMPSMPSAAEVAGRAPVEPPRYKRAVASALAVLPVVTALQPALGQVIADWPLPLQTLAFTVVVAPTITYVTLPLATRLLAGWLRAPSPRARSRS